MPSSQAQTKVRKISEVIAVGNPQSNAADRPLQIGPTPKQSLKASMYAAFNAVSGRAWPRKSRRRRQDLVRLAQFRDLGAQALQLGGRLLRGARGGDGGRPVGLVAPSAQRLRRHPQALRDRGNGLRLRRMIRTRLLRKPERLRLKLLRVTSLSGHVPSLPSNEIKHGTKNQATSLY